MAKEKQLKNHRHGFILGIVFVLICVFGIMYYFNFRDDVRKKDYISIDGYIYDYIYSDGCDYDYYEDNNESCMMTPLVEYFVDGVRYTVKSKSSSTHPKFIGTKVEVKYNQENPDDSFISGKDSGEILVLIASVFFGVCGLLALFSSIKGYLRD